MKAKKIFLILLIICLAFFFGQKQLRLKSVKSFPEPPVLEKLISLELYSWEPTIKPISSQEIEIDLKNGPQVIVSSQKDIRAQLDSLQLILLRAKIEGKKIKRVDLRFNKPVVVYE